MKTKTKILTGIMILTTLVLFHTGCPQPTQEEQAKPQSATINPFEDLQLTVKGTFKDSEWTGVARKIESAITTHITGLPGFVQSSAVAKYAKCETIFVEKTSEYVNWKTVGDGKTMYFNYNILNDAGLASLIETALASMDANGNTTAKVIAPVPQYNRAMMMRDNRIARRTT